jgi:hypothetical protein
VDARRSERHTADAAGGKKQRFNRNNEEKMPEPPLRLAGYRAQVRTKIVR